MNRDKVNKEFEDLFNIYKNQKFIYGDFDELNLWYTNYKEASNIPKSNIVYYAFIIFIILIILISAIWIYYSIKPNTDTIKSMLDSNNVNDVIDISETNDEYDDDGNLIIYDDE